MLELMLLARLVLISNARTIYLFNWWKMGLGWSERVRAEQNTVRDFFDNLKESGSIPILG